jgi:uncharacterized cofD-like protein
MLPPGDIRNCLVALSDDESLLNRLFQYRFSDGEGLRGHNFGNLFIAAMTEVTQSFETALVESSRVLAVHGQVIPATMTNIVLKAQFADGSIVEGESDIRDHHGKIGRISIDPVNAPAHPLAIQAIEQADLLVVGPGSLYTSLLPNLLVSEICDTIKKHSAPTIYVCNLATERGETEGFTIADHISAIRQFTFRNFADYVLSSNYPSNTNSNALSERVINDGRSVLPARLELFDLTDDITSPQHSSLKLADAIMEIYQISRNVEI